VLASLLSDAQLESLYRFDHVQLAEVVRVCASCRMLSEAGRQLFAVSRAQRASHNDADRLHKYLVRLGLSWAQIAER